MPAAVDVFFPLVGLFAPSSTSCGSVATLEPPNPQEAGLLALTVALAMPRHRRAAEGFGAGERARLSEGVSA